MSRTGKSDNSAPDDRLLYQTAREILDRYRDYWPLTVRQLGWRLMQQVSMPLSPESFERLFDVLVRGIVVGEIEFDAVVDEMALLGFPGSASVRPPLPGDGPLPGSLVPPASVRDRHEGQARLVSVLTVHTGMIPQLRRIADPTGTRVIATGLAVGLESPLRRFQDAVTLMNAAGGRGITFILVDDLFLDGSQPRPRPGLADYLGTLAGILERSEVAFSVIPLEPEVFVGWGMRMTEPPYEGWIHADISAIPPDQLAVAVRSRIEEKLDMARIAEVLRAEERQSAATTMAAAGPLH